jgi:hypothetical protein
VNLRSSASNPITGACIPGDRGHVDSDGLEPAGRRPRLPAGENAGVPASVNLTFNPTARR